MWEHCVNEEAISVWTLVRYSAYNHVLCNMNYSMLNTSNMDQGRDKDMVMHVWFML
jgi:hypothetical protein